MPDEADPKSVATPCLTAWSTGDFAMTRALLDDALTFTGPLGATDGAHAYIEGIKGWLRSSNGSISTRVFGEGEGEDVCVVYDLITKKPQARIPTADWYKVRDGRITSVRAFFDARPLAAPG
jgi:ketosteroid isomerase-like protein